MDGECFDDLTRSLAGDLSRRRALKLLAAAAAGGLTSLLGRHGAEAGKRCSSDLQCPKNQGCTSNGHCTNKCDPAAAPLCPACKTPACTATGYQCRSTPDGQTCNGSSLCCGGSCVDHATDPTNCGACGHICATGQCRYGVCACPAVQKACGPNGECADTQTDAGNCGACGVTCTGGKTCIGGQCQCPLGQTDCSGVCKTTCEIPCVAECRAPCAACDTTSGLCVPINQGAACPLQGDVQAGRCCDNICRGKSDNFHCGGCGITCPGEYACCGYNADGSDGLCGTWCGGWCCAIGTTCQDLNDGVGLRCL